MRDFEEGLALEQAHRALLPVDAGLDAAGGVERDDGAVRQGDLLLVPHARGVEIEARGLGDLDGGVGRREHLARAHQNGHRDRSGHAETGQHSGAAVDRRFARRISEGGQHVEIVPVAREAGKGVGMQRAGLFPGLELCAFFSGEAALVVAHDPAGRLLLDGGTVREIQDVA